MTAFPTLFQNGCFWTLETGRPDACGLLARGGRIERVFFASEELRAYREGLLRLYGSDLKVVDLEGRTAVPGPVDAHCHLVSYGMIRSREADLRKCASLDDLRRRLREHAERSRVRPDDQRWLLGRGFEQDFLAERRWPTRQDLDAVAPDVPVRITRVCGHALVANTAALCAAGLDPSYQEPGLPEGVVTEQRMAPVYQAIPEPDHAEWVNAARWACEEAARVGFVGVHSLMAHEREIRALLDLQREGPLPIRVTMQLPFSLLEPAAAAGFRTGFGDDYLRIGAIKLFSDGSLGARTAALQEPYTDAPDTSGELILEPDELARRVRRTYEAGFQSCVHAIGDRAMQVTLDAFAAAPLDKGAPPRIEHASLVDAAIVRRMQALGVGAAIQPQFARSDYWAPDRLGADRARGCYAFRTLWEAGIPLAGSTDCPVESLDALAAIGQLVCRPEWSPDEGLPLATVLRVFSEGSYQLLGMRPESGQMGPGGFADFLVLEQDPRGMEACAIEEISVSATIVGGHLSWPAC